MEAIIGIGIVLFLLIYVAFKVNSEELKLFLVLAVLGLGVFIPVNIMVESNDCDFLVSNETVTGNTTLYTYEHTCITNTARQELANNFHKSYMTAFVIIGGLLFIILLKQSIIWLIKSVKKIK